MIAEIADRRTMLTLGFLVMAPMRPTNRLGTGGADSLRTFLAPPSLMWWTAPAPSNEVP
jgi:hypothetical protein